MVNFKNKLLFMSSFNQRRAYNGLDAKETDTSFVTELGFEFALTQLALSNVRMKMFGDHNQLVQLDYYCTDPLYKVYNTDTMHKHECIQERFKLLQDRYAETFTSLSNHDSYNATKLDLTTKIEINLNGNVKDSLDLLNQLEIGDLREDLTNLYLNIDKDDHIRNNRFYRLKLDHTRIDSYIMLPPIHIEMCLYIKDDDPSIRHIVSYRIKQKPRPCPDDRSFHHLFCLVKNALTLLLFGLGHQKFHATKNNNTFPVSGTYYSTFIPVYVETQPNKSKIYMVEFSEEVESTR